MVNFLWIVVGLATIVSSGILLIGLTLAESAIQEGAWSAMAVAFVVIPYCLARAAEKLAEE